VPFPKLSLYIPKALALVDNLEARQTRDASQKQEASRGAPGYFARQKQKCLAQDDNPWERGAGGETPSLKLSNYRSVAMEKEVHHRGDDQQCQQEAKDSAATVALWSDGRGVEWQGLWEGCFFTRRRSRQAGSIEAGSHFPVDHYVHASGVELAGKLLRQFGRKLLHEHGYQL
jgi:hypothetical protein